MDKKFHELRLVYQAVKAPEPVFAMFRVRPVQDSPTLPPEAKAENNKVMSFLGRPTLSPQIGVITSLILGIIGLLAGYFPARRAASVDPAATLRYE